MNLDDLKRQLEQDAKAGLLVFTTTTQSVVALMPFLQNLPTRQLTLTQCTVTPMPPTQPTSLTVSGAIDEFWTMRGVSTPRLHIQHATLVFTDGTNGFDVQLSLEGEIIVGAQHLAIVGNLDQARQLHFALKPPSNVSVALPDIANLVSNNMLAAYLPTGVSIFSTVPLSALNISFGFERNAITQFTVSSDFKGHWKIIDPWGTLEGVGIWLTSQFVIQRDGRFVHSFGGYIYATLHITGKHFDQDFKVSIGLLGQNQWEVALIPHDGNLLPGLKALANLAGGDDLEQSVQAGLDALGLSAMSLDAVRIGFDLATLSLRYVQIQAHITVDDLTFYILVYLPNFAFYGSLSPDTPIHLSALVAKYFGKADAFPDIEIAALGISAEPNTGSYLFSATIVENWIMKLGDVALVFLSFDFDIRKTKTDTTGSISAKFLLAGAEFTVAAVQEPDGNGWDFFGSTGPGQTLELGALMTELAKSFTGADPAMPAVIAKLGIRNLRVSFNTQSGDFTFDCEVMFPVGDQEADMTVSIVLTRGANKDYSKNLRGQLTIGALQFNLHFLEDATDEQTKPNDTFTATYSHTPDAAHQNIQQLISQLSPSVAAYVPSTLEIDLQDMLFAYQSSDANNTFLFGLDINLTGIPSLSALPMVGALLPSEQRIALKSLRVLVASRVIQPDMLSKFNSLLPSTGTLTPLPTTPLSQGVNAAAEMDFGGTTHTLAVPVSGGAAKPEIAPQPTAAQPPGVAASDTAKWFDVQKTFGPVNFKRVGVQYLDGKLMFLLDAALSAAGLTLSLDGLGFGSSLNAFKPDFSLRGLGLDYTAGPLEIGGAFLRESRTENDITYDEFNGEAILRSRLLSLAAFGSYAYYKGHPSLFIYALLDYPLGGPTFFFVTGLAAGFGYNRTLTLPPVDQVEAFPLIKAAQPSSSPVGKTDLLNLLSQLEQQNAVPPMPGQYFFAAGIRFTSFKIISSFALLTVSFGDEFEIDLLGLSTMVAPAAEAGKSVPPVAVVQVAFKASFIPAQGFLGLAAQLTANSFLFSRNCHLVGGFAFYSWFSGEHAGDFVVTLGGYHPSFKPLPHYPVVPRLGVNWQVTSELIVKGEAYFALTPSTLMAGGLLQITWESGRFMAWFYARADFLLGWKPFHYQADVWINIGVRYTMPSWLSWITHEISVEISAELHLWGPEFSGVARIDIKVASVDIAFGSGATNKPQAIDWDGGEGAFCQSFLPVQGVCNASVTGGLVRTWDKPGPNNTTIKVWIINAEHFQLTTDSVIPSKTAQLGPDTAAIPLAHGNTDFGVAPMALPKEQLHTQHRIIIRRDQKPVSDDFVCTPVFKRVPTALWGESNVDTVEKLGKQPALADGVLTGFVITPAQKPEAGSTQSIALSNLQYSPDPVQDAFSWGTDVRVFAPAEGTDAAQRSAITQGLSDGAAARTKLLGALGLASSTINLKPNLSAAFTLAPQVATS